MVNRPRWPDCVGDTADGLYVVDRAQRIVRWNDGAARILGHVAEDVLNRPCYEVVAGCGRNGRPICGPDCPVHRSVEDGELPRSMEIQAVARDRHRVWLRQSIIVVPHDAGPMKVHVLSDVSDHRHTADVMAQVASLCQANEIDPAATGTAAVALTNRERQVLRLLADGLSGSLVAARLGVSDCTVRNHIQNLLIKVGAHSRAEAVSLAFRRRLI